MRGRLGLYVVIGLSAALVGCNELGLTGRKKGRRHLSRVLAAWPIRFTLRARPACRPVKDILPPAGGTLLRS